jgi:hypothetical protein
MGFLMLEICMLLLPCCYFIVVASWRAVGPAESLSAKDGGHGLLVTVEIPFRLGAEKEGPTGRRETALWLGRRRARLGRAELGLAAGGMDYAAVGQAVSRFGKRPGKKTEPHRKL